MATPVTGTVTAVTIYPTGGEPSGRTTFARQMVHDSMEAFLYVIDWRNGRILQVDLATDALVPGADWLPSDSLPRDVMSSLLISSDDATLYAGGDDGTLYSIDLATKAITSLGTISGRALNSMFWLDEAAGVIVFGDTFHKPLSYFDLATLTRVDFDYATYWPPKLIAADAAWIYRAAKFGGPGTQGPIYRVSRLQPFRTEILAGYNRNANDNGAAATAGVVANSLCVNADLVYFQSGDSKLRCLNLTTAQITQITGTSPAAGGGELEACLHWLPIRQKLYAHAGSLGLSYVT